MYSNKQKKLYHTLCPKTFTFCLLVQLFNIFTSYPLYQLILSSVQWKMKHAIKNPGPMEFKPGVVNSVPAAFMQTVFSKPYKHSAFQRCNKADTTTEIRTTTATMVCLSYNLWFSNPIQWATVNSTPQVILLHAKCF